MRNLLSVAQLVARVENILCDISGSKIARFIVAVPSSCSNVRLTVVCTPWDRSSGKPDFSLSSLSALVVPIPCGLKLNCEAWWSICLVTFKLGRNFETPETPGLWNYEILELWNSDSISTWFLRFEALMFLIRFFFSLVAFLNYGKWAQFRAWNAPTARSRRVVNGSPRQHTCRRGLPNDSTIRNRIAKR